MGIFDSIKKGLSKIPLISRTSARFVSLFNPFSGRSSYEYYQSWVYLAVSTIAQEVAGIQIKLFKTDSKGNVEQIFKHPALELLAHANNFMTQYDVFERLQSNQELRGNEFWFLTYAGKTPSNILPLPSGAVTPVAGVYDYVEKYIYRVEGKTFEIPLANMVHFKQFNPKSDIYGLSTLEAARVAADTDNSAREYNKKYFQNDARPDVILKYPEALKKEDEKRLVEAWNQNHGGPSRQFKTAVASGGLEIDAFQISQRDMEFLEGRKFNRDEIMAIFRVPLAVAGYTGNETYASAKAATYSFGMRTIKPKMRRIINTLNEFYLPKFPDTEGMFFEFESPVLEDREQIIKEYESGLKNGWYSINDIRRMEDLPEIEGADDVMIPLNLMALGSPKKGKEVVEPVKKEPITIDKMVGEIMTKTFGEMKKPKKKELTDEEKRFEKMGVFMQKARDERGLEFEKQFKQVLNQLWDGQKQRAINKLKSSLDQKDWKVKAPNVIDNRAEVEATVDLLTPLMTELTEKEGLAALEFLGILGDEIIIMTPEIQDFIKGNTKKLAGEVTDVTSKKLRAQIAAGLEKGEAIVDLEKRILDSTAFSVARAENIARSETIRAQTKAELQVWKQTGVVKAKVWYTAVDERVCPYCEPMNGKTIKLNDAYFRKGEEHEGNDGTMLSLDYETVEGPPLHPQCRCVLIPEVA